MAFPDRQVVAFVGDGGFTMLMMEFVTAVKHKLPIKVIHRPSRALQAFITWGRVFQKTTPKPCAGGRRPPSKAM